MIDAEYDRDRTATGAEHAARCRAVRPDPAAKAEAWSLLINDDSLSNRMLFATADGFWCAGQEELTAAYVERYVTDMPVMAGRRAAQVAEKIAEFAYPAVMVDEGTLATMAALADDPTLTPAFRRAFVDANDELSRSLAARSVSERARGV